MKLDDWLTHEVTQADQLRVVEKLAEAINVAHERGEPLAALEPGRIDVGSDLSCDLSAARRGTPPRAYVAPERAEGGPPSPESDVYVAGLIFWEILAGRSPGAAPVHLAEARPDLAQELADAIMACLERSAEWRPKDLTYVAQLAQQAHAPRGAERARTGSTPRAGAATRPATRAPSLRAGTRRESRSQLPLAIAAVLVLAAAGGSYYWLRQQGTDDGARPAVARPSSGLPTARPSATMTPTAGPAPSSAPSATPAPTPTASAGPAAAAATPAPTPRPTTASAQSAAPVTPVTLPTPIASTPRTAPPATDAPVSATTAPTTTVPAVAARPDLPSEPPAAATISPLTARRPGKVLFDVRGSSLHAALRARVIPLRQAPLGISVVRQKCADPTLVSVLLDFDATVAPGAYALVLEDATGRQTKPLTFTVVK